MITIVIADDQMMIREGLRTILDLEDDMEVVGVAGNGIEVCKMVDQLRPTLVMMDIQMPEMDGISALRKIKQNHPDTSILILTTFLEDNYIVDGLASGANGYILKDMDTDKMLAAIRDTVSGQFILPIAVASKLASRMSQMELHRSPGTTVDQRIRLTERERDIAELVVKGRNNRDIAAALYISEGTVRNYMSNLYSKLGVMDRLQASIRLRELLANEGNGPGK
ncbi:DNA-binding response regulator, NarL/FixJ family, contains REC and HTH domains [Fontibacillus panacisegetis]|uniref:DNA-binding response regulator, NarL/FixJ family, contains REC and HTH domains n=1 Tax=Fontibacillus panacisegetis TaxID=670482 RepID=A0A1G7L6N9_9BACL|nr:response regulator transcription factor [Fontibacillus panacisegetis]SDF45105.1 DNA-binding response regulator, NarL/FixJ family, contains REC and HTH domains [Fontibacillus panacisegetis]